jgi:hypothetical protein
MGRIERVFRLDAYVERQQICKCGFFCGLFPLRSGRAMKYGYGGEDC